MGGKEQSNIARQKAHGIAHYPLLSSVNSYGRSFLPTPSWIGSLFLCDRRVCPTAAVTRAAPITIPKITSIVIGFPFQCVETLNVRLGSRGYAVAEGDSSLVRKERVFGVRVRPGANLRVLGLNGPRARDRFGMRGA